VPIQARTRLPFLRRQVVTLHPPICFSQYLSRRMCLIGSKAMGFRTETAVPNRLTMQAGKEGNQSGKCQANNDA
jgi:hypothetical protein